MTWLHQVVPRVQLSSLTVPEMVAWLSWWWLLPGLRCVSVFCLHEQPSHSDAPAFPLEASARACPEHGCAPRLLFPKYSSLSTWMQN